MLRTHEINELINEGVDMMMMMMMVMIAHYYSLAGN